MFFQCFCEAHYFWKQATSGPQLRTSTDNRCLHNRTYNEPVSQLTPYPFFSLWIMWYIFTKEQTRTSKHIKKMLTVFVNRHVCLLFIVVADWTPHETDGVNLPIIYLLFVCSYFFKKRSVYGFNRFSNNYIVIWKKLWYEEVWKVMSKY